MSQNSRNGIDGHETRAMSSYRRRYVIWDEFILFFGLEYLKTVSGMCFSRGTGVLRQVTCVAFCYTNEPFLITPYIVIYKRKCNCVFNKHLFGHLNIGVVDHAEFLILHSNEPQACVAYF